MLPECVVMRTGYLDRVCILLETIAHPDRANICSWQFMGFRPFSLPLLIVLYFVILFSQNVLKLLFSPNNLMLLSGVCDYFRLVSYKLRSV